MANRTQVLVDVHSGRSKVAKERTHLFLPTLNDR